MQPPAEALAQQMDPDIESKRAEAAKLAWGGGAAVGVASASSLSDAGAPQAPLKVSSMPRRASPRCSRLPGGNITMGGSPLAGGLKRRGARLFCFSCYFLFSFFSLAICCLPGLRFLLPLL
jgi:hypothetical protein